MEIFGLSIAFSLMLVLAISGVVSFGLIALLKMAYAAYLASTPEEDREPWYWNTQLRALAIIVGTATGSVFSFAGLHVIVALGVGFAGGVLNTLIVKQIKDRIKAFKLSKDEDEEEGQK